MRRCIQRLGVVFLCSSVLLSGRALAQSTAFTFQGKLQSRGGAGYGDV